MRALIFTLGVVCILLCGQDSAAVSLAAGGCLIYLFIFAKRYYSRQDTTTKNTHDYGKLH